MTEAAILHPRSDWLPPGQEAFPGSPAFAPRLVDHLTAHYAGIDGLDLDGPDDVWQAADTARILLAMHRNYLAERGYGLGYSFAVDEVGHAWTVRGFAIRAASDGSVRANERTASVLFLGRTPDSDPTPAAITAARFLADTTVTYCGPQVTRWTTHSDHFGTRCPGPKWTALVRNGQLWPQPQESEDTMVHGDLVNVTDDPDFPAGVVYLTDAAGLFYRWVRNEAELAFVQARRRLQGASTVPRSITRTELASYGVLIGETPWLA